KNFDLEKMKFSIPKITVSDINAKIVQVNVSPPTVEPPQDTTAGTSLDIDIGVLDFSKIKVDFQSEPSAINAQLNLGSFKADLKKIDLQKEILEINTLE